MVMSKPLSYWSVTIGNNFHELVEPNRLKEIFTEFFDQFVFQGEYGDKNKKPHFQCRVKKEDKISKASLLQLFSCRGIPVNDVTALPESNNSIQQGGLTFYCMDDQKDIWCKPIRDGPEMRPKGWIPAQCQSIVDNPRPWMTSLMEKIDSFPDHRKIIWICTLDGKGGVGKSLFNTWLEASQKGIYLGSGTPTQILEATIAEGEHRCFTLDLPKSGDTNIKLTDYINVIETVKNGFIKTAMHGKRKKLIMNNRPHVIVFSNILPVYKAMTEGRIECYTINPDKDPDKQTLDPYAQVSPGLQKGI